MLRVWKDFIFIFKALSNQLYFNFLAIFTFSSFIPASAASVLFPELSGVSFWPPWGGGGGGGGGKEGGLKNQGHGNRGACRSHHGQYLSLGDLDLGQPHLSFS